MKIDKYKIYDNCKSESGWPNVDYNINKARLVDLLASHTTSRGDLGRRCKELLEQMEENDWRIAAGIHSGGIGGGGRNPDERQHITLTVNRQNYHLRFGGAKSSPTLVQITP
jgi:hypothetical protein